MGSSSFLQYSVLNEFKKEGGSIGPSYKIVSLRMLGKKKDHLTLPIR